MTVILSTNYSASGTAFSWADADTDAFDRDLITLVAKALEQHTHADTRGLAVTRLASNAVVTASITDLAVTTGKIDDLGVTTGKLAANAVTAAKLGAAACTGAALGTDVIKTTGTQAIAAGLTVTDPVLSGNVDVQGILLLDKGTDVPSGSSIALGTGGNLFKITGTTTVNTITIKAVGTEVTLWFSGICSVGTSGNIVLKQGPFVGKADSFLKLISDGTNWHELSRTGSPPIGCRLIRSTTQVIADTYTDTAISWSSASWNNGAIWTSGTDITPGFVGKYRVHGHVTFTTGGNVSQRAVVYRAGSSYEVGWAMDSTSASNGTVGDFDAIVDITSTSQVIDIRAAMGAGDVASAVVYVTFLHP